MNENNKRDIILDLSKVEYASPYFVLPMAMHILTNEINLELILSEVLQNIFFPKGLEIEGLRPLLINSKLNEFVNKEFLPIVIFPSETLKENTSTSVMNLIEKCLYTQLDSKSNVKSCLKYVLGK